MTSPAAPRTLWYTRCPVPSATAVALTRGLLQQRLADRGVRLRSLGESPDPATRLAHYTHRHPALLREGGVVPPLRAVADHGGTVLLGLARVAQSQGLVALRERGLDARSLRGARVALPLRRSAPVDFARTVSWQGIHDTLAAAGLADDDVELVDVELDEPFLSLTARPGTASVYTARENVRLHTAEVLALVRGQVDAIYVAGPHGAAIAAIVDAAPVPGLWDEATDRGWTGNHLRVLTASAALLDDDPEALTAYVAALLEAARWAQTDHDLAWRTIAAEVGVAQEWAQTAYHPAVVDRLGPTGEEDLLDALQRRADFAQERGLLPASVDVRAWWRPDVLAAARASLEAIAR